jgi:integrase
VVDRLHENRPELKIFRAGPTEPALDALVAAFGGGNRRLGERYALALATYLGGDPGDGDWESYAGRLSPNTRELYASTLEEFFEWIARKYGRVVPPHDVTHRDVEDYANWLATRPFSLTVERLKDGDKTERLAIFQAVQKLGSADVRSVEATLPAQLKETHTVDGRFNTAWLDFEMGRMVLHDTLVREPTLEQIRREHPRAGIDQWEIPITVGNKTRMAPLRELFFYSVPKPKPVQRTTIATKLAALSAFWDVLTRGENIAGGEPLLKHNVIVPIQKRISRGLSAERRAAAARQRVDGSVVARLLRAVEGPSLTDKRNKALLYFLIFTGVRVTEALALRRGRPPASEENRWPGWFEATDPPTVLVTRKGGRRMYLPYPTLALRALDEFQAALRDRAPPDGAQHTDPNAPGYLHSDSSRWRYRELAIMPDSPLFPPVSFWGANSSANYQAYKPNVKGHGIPYTRPMTRHGVTKLLGRLSIAAGLTPEERRQVHPHAIRHLAATAMYKGGKDLREIQAILGHDSITTTERYLEEVEDFVALSGQHEILEYLAQFEPAAAPPPRRPEKPSKRREGVVETVAYPLPEEAPERPPRRPRKPPKRPLPREVEATVGAAEVDQADEVEVLPEHMTPVSPNMPDDPVVSLREEGPPLIAVGAAAEDPEMFEMRDGSSPGSPEWVYEAMEPAAVEAAEVAQFTRLQRRSETAPKGITIRVNVPDKGRDKGKKVELVQQNMFLFDNYDPWPQNYGIGTSSLLVWFAKGAADKGGVVKAKVGAETIEIPPLPVFAPEQVYPETTSGSDMLDFVLGLYERWLHGDAAAGIPPSPTKTYGLVRWYGFFAMATGRLESFLKEKKAKHPFAANHPSWVPFDQVAKLKKNVRAHDPEYLKRWLETNAHTFTTTYRAFEQVPRGRGEDPDTFWATFQAAAYEGAVPAVAGAPIQQIPEWFTSVDPVRDIYDEDPKEWDRFVKWLRNVTGSKITRDRERERKEQKTFAVDALEAKRKEARALLDAYYDAVDTYIVLDRHIRSEGREQAEEAAKYGQTLEEIRDARAQSRDDIKWMTEELEKKGVADPATVKETPKRAERIEALLTAAFPESVGLTDPNVLADSSLFDPEMFTIDSREKTIVHTPAFVEDFKRRYGRDPDLITRRAARAMWERARMRGEIEKKPKREEYSALYSVMLSYLAWVVPAPEEMERRMYETGTHATGQPTQARRAWLETYIETLHDALGAPTRIPGVADEDALRAYYIEQGVDPATVNDVIQSLKIQIAFQSEVEAVQVDAAAQIAAELGEEGAMRIRAPGRRKKKSEEPEPVEPSPVIFVAPQGTDVVKPGVVRRRKLQANPRTVFALLRGEKPTTWFRSRTGFGGDYAPNAARYTYVSPGAWSAYVKNAEPIRDAMPSPFRMIAAMSLA